MPHIPSGLFTISLASVFCAGGGLGMCVTARGLQDEIQDVRAIAQTLQADRAAAPCSPSETAKLKKDMSEIIAQRHDLAIQFACFQQTLTSCVNGEQDCTQDSFKKILHTCTLKK
jgi:hypothetical protein